jgi:hypothetical protein
MDLWAGVLASAPSHASGTYKVILLVATVLVIALVIVMRIVRRR